MHKLERPLRDFFRRNLSSERRESLGHVVQEGICRCCMHYSPGEYSNCPTERECLHGASKFGPRKTGPEMLMKRADVLAQIRDEFPAVSAE